MLFDLNLLFSNAQSISNTSTSTASSVIDLQNARDLGQGNDGIGGVPKVGVFVGTAITSACAGCLLNIIFQGSTDSSNWTTYIETGPMTTASLGAGTRAAVFDWPERQAGAALPRYVRLLYSYSSMAALVVSTGIVTAGIILEAQQNAIQLYPSGFSAV